MARSDFYIMVAVLCLVCMIDFVKSCGLHPLPSAATKRYFRMRIGNENCFNPDTVEGVVECRGACASISKYRADDWSIERRCECCAPAADPRMIQVAFECSSGAEHVKEVPVPTECNCVSCEALLSLETPHAL